MEGLTLVLGQGDHPHARGSVPDAAIPDGEAVFRHTLDHGGRARLLLHLVAVVALAQGLALEEAVGARSRVAAVQADGGIGVRAGQTQLTPPREIRGVPAASGLGEHGVHLGQGQAGDGIVLVDEDGQGIQRSAQERGGVPEALLELVLLRRLHGPGHGSQLGGSLDQRRRSRARALALDLDAHIGVVLAEGLKPERHQVVHGV